MKKEIFLTKALNYSWQACTEVKLQYKLTPLCTYGSASRLDYTVLRRPCTVSVQTHGGLYCTEVVLLTTLVM